MTEALAVYQPATPATLLQIAIDKGADLEKLEKLMELQTRWEAQQAKKAYSEAMTAFKAKPPEIEKDKKVSFKTSSGVTAYNHASLANVTKTIGSELSKYGLSSAWVTKQDEKGVTVTCRISHILGHSEETSLTAALDTSGGKNNIQALGSTISYLERYTILALTGLATHEMDDDGKTSEETKFIDDKQKSTILDYINGKQVDESKFLQYMKCESIETIPAADFNKAVASLKAAKGKANANNSK
jgi:hypothetical protein